jgi:hypothetical protein
MKKLTIFIAGFMLLAFTAQAEIRVGISLSAGAFEVDGASEKFSGSHSSGAGSTVTKNASTDGDEAEGLFGIGSIFVEKSFGKFALGLDYVPLSLESETTENTQTTSTSSATGVNKVQIDFENLMTVYGTIALNDNVYAKAGYMEVDVVTNEVLATGGAYGDTSLDGFVVGLGYNADLDNSAFVRVEATYMEFDGATLTNTADSAKSVTADGITGYGAKLSIGKAF